MIDTSWLWWAVPTTALPIAITQVLYTYSLNAQRPVNAWDVVMIMGNNALVVGAVMAIPFLMWVGEVITGDQISGYDKCIAIRLGRRGMRDYLLAKVTVVIGLAATISVVTLMIWLGIGTALLGWGSWWSPFIRSHSPYLPIGNTVLGISPFLAAAEMAALLAGTLATLALVALAVSALVKATYVGVTVGALVTGLSVWLATSPSGLRWSLIGQGIWLLHGPYASVSLGSIPFSWSVGYFVLASSLAAIVILVDIHRRRNW